MVVGDFPLVGKIAVVTGGGSGINLSFVKLALASQAKVLIADIKLLKEAEDLIRSPDTAGRVAYAKCDICDWDQLNRLPAEVESAFGEGVVADVWVAGAGVFEPNLSSFFADKEDDCYRAMRINAEHPIKLTRIAMRSCLKANKPGVVLIVASGAGVVGFYGSPLYCATKHAVVGFIKSMAQADKDENVKIVSVCPGIVATPLWKGKDAEEVAKQYAYDDEMSLTPEEVANAMKDLIEQGKFGGGSLLEVSKTRGVNQLESNELTQGLGPEAQTWVERCYAPESYPMNERATDIIMEDSCTTNAHEDSDDQVMDTTQSATSPNTQTALQTQPKTFPSLPRELRDRIYGLCFECESPVVVFAGKDRPSHYQDGSKDPEMTAQIASKHVLMYPVSFATFGGHVTSSSTHDEDSVISLQTPTSVAINNSSPHPTRSNKNQNGVSTAATTLAGLKNDGTNWSKSLTGILYANKQISCEAVPYLYQSCTFFFEDLDSSKKFLDIVRPATLELVRNVFIYYPDELEHVYAPDNTPFDNSGPMRQKFHLLCKGVVRTMPNIKELTIWIGKILELEHRSTRCSAYEGALLQLADLRQVETLIVKKYGEVFDNSGDEDARWDGSNEYTVEGVTEMIATGDRMALERMRKAFEEGLDVKKE